MSLAEKVKRLREIRGMNQKRLAERSELTQATISRIESGDVSELRSEALRRLSEALEVPADYLIGKSDRQSPEELATLDPRARTIFRGYEKLGPAAQRQVEDFVNFLKSKQKKKQEGNAD